MHVKLWTILMALMAGMLIPYAVSLLIRTQIAETSAPVNKTERIITVDGQEMNAEDYLIRLTAAEIPAEYQMEAIKAQAVIERTYLYKAMEAGEKIEEDELYKKGITEKEMSQKWGVYTEGYYKKIKQAVQQTESQIITYNEEAINAFYHQVSSGTTRTDVSNVCPYLKSKESAWDISAPGYTQMKILTQDQLIKTLQEVFPDKKINTDSILTQIQILDKDSSGYIELLQIGGCEFQGNTIADALGMSSACITFEEYEGKLRISGRGIGNGYGMSQWGADQMGNEGKTYVEILSYYYDGIEITER